MRVHQHVKTWYWVKIFSLNIIFFLDLSYFEISVSNKFVKKSSFQDSNPLKYQFKYQQNIVHQLIKWSFGQVHVSQARN